MHHAFFEGFAIGLAYAAPIGPVAVLCLRRTLTANWLSGILSGLGSATAISIYSSIVVLGTSLIIDFLDDYQAWLRILSGLFLCYLGFSIISLQPSKLSSIQMSGSYRRCYSTTFVLAFVTALPDLTFPVFVLNQLSHLESANFYHPIQFSAGVLASEALWWLVFCSVCWKLKFCLSFKVLRWINYASGSAIGLLGLTTVLKQIF